MISRDRELTVNFIHDNATLGAFFVRRKLNRATTGNIPKLFLHRLFRANIRCIVLDYLSPTLLCDEGCRGGLTDTRRTRQ